MTPELRRFLNLGDEPRRGTRMADGPPIDDPKVCAACYGEFRLAAQDLAPIPIRHARSTKAILAERRAREETARARAAAIAARWQRQLNLGCHREEAQLSPEIRHRLIVGG